MNINKIIKIIKEDWLKWLVLFVAIMIPFTMAASMTLCEIYTLFCWAGFKDAFKATTITVFSVMVGWLFCKGCW